MITWKLNGSSDSLQEPYEITDNDPYIELKLTNISGSDLSSLGFYITATSASADYSVMNPHEMIDYILNEGDAGRGITIKQDTTETIFSNSIGNGPTNKIPLTVGTGTLFDEIADSAYVIISLKINVDVTAAQYIYYDIVLE